VFEYPDFLSPVAFTFLGFGIRWYSLSYIFGFIYFYLFAKKNLQYFNLKKKVLDDLFFYQFISIIIGGRIGYIIFYNFNFYISNPIEIFKVWEGGMSFHGALFGVIMTTILFCKIKSLSIMLISDLLSICAPVGIFLGRLSNFMNQELVGRQTNFFISIKYPNEEFYRHISQIYEALFEGLIPAIVLIILFYSTRLKQGVITGLFLLNYSLSRFMIEFIREPDSQIGLKNEIFSQGQLLSIPILFLGLFFIYKCQFKQK
jgi:phosphatidylglycerol:prolipoprotein diacylglycerol transferase